MNLPHYFLADRPPDAPLGAGLVSDACQELKRNRERYLAHRSTTDLIEVIAEVARDWLQPDNPFRKLALEHGPQATGFTAQILEAGLDALFAAINPKQLEALLLQDLGEVGRLDDLRPGQAEAQASRMAYARGPELMAHIVGGVLPNPALHSLVLGLLVRSAQFVKCASGTSLLPRLFAHSLREAEPKLGACIEIAEWKGGTESLESALFQEVDCLVATGSDETLAALKSRVPAHVRFLGYGHRVSFGYVAREVLAPRTAEKLITQAVADVVAWNQLGCLSPHLFYVETGGRVSPERFAEHLAGGLAAFERTHPRGSLPAAQAAAISSRRAFYEIRAAHSQDTRMWTSPNSTAWTVVYENDPLFQLSCLNRFVYVKAVAGPEAAIQGADAVRGQVSTVGLAASESRERLLARSFARWGVTRLCPLGQMQHPPLAWRHDGRPCLGDLVTWTDWEL